MNRLRVGVMGSGQISKRYLLSFRDLFADTVEVAAVADVVPEVAAERAAAFDVPAVSPEELLGDESVKLILNLTPAPAHHAVSRSILDAGKHVYSEKPLALSMDHGRDLVERAKGNGLMLAAAPDTILGAGVQTGRRVLDSGQVGDVIAGHALACVPVRSERYYVTFRGPLLDMGPYFVGALVALLGPVAEVAAVAAEATFLDQGHAGRTLDAPARSAAALHFAGGAVVTLAASSELVGYSPFLRLYGTLGTMTGTDPNQFGGETLVKVGNDPDAPAEVRHAHSDNSRGLGVADMAAALAENRPPRLTADFALHTLEVLLGVIESAKTGRRVAMTTTCDRPAPMPET